MYKITLRQLLNRLQNKSFPSVFKFLVTTKIFSYFIFTNKKINLIILNSFFFAINPRTKENLKFRQREGRIRLVQKIKTSSQVKVMALSF